MDANPIFATQMFRFLTPADPGTVWQLLTPEPGRHSSIYGLAAFSDWAEGSELQLRSRAHPSGAGPAIVGQVLRAEPGVRLSHSLGDHADHPSVYVTWEIGDAGLGCVVRLYVDDLDADPGDPADVAEIEQAWLPVIGALQSELARCAS